MSNQPYVHQAYPAWRYHATQPGRVIQSPEEERPDWQSEPFPEAPAGGPAGEAPATSDEALMEEVARLADELDAEKAKREEQKASFLADWETAQAEITDLKGKLAKATAPKKPAPAPAPAAPKPDKP